MQLLLRGLVGAVVISAVWAVMSLHAAEAVKEETPAKEVTGTVVKACPKGCFIKIKAEDGTEVGMLPVAGDANKETVKALKAGEQVTLTIVQCPKTKKDTVSKVAKVEAETK